MGNLDLNPLAADFGLDDSGKGTKGYPRFVDYAVEIGESRGTPRTVAAHLGVAAVRVEEYPFEVSFGVVFNENQPIGSDGYFSAAGKARKLACTLFFNSEGAVVDYDKIVTASSQFPERDSLSRVHVRHF